MEGITYKQYCDSRGITVQRVRMKINRAVEKGLLTKVSVFENTQIPNNVLSFLAGSVIPYEAKQDVAVKQPKAAKQATIPARYSVQYTEPEKRGIETPVKSQMSSVFSSVLSFSASDAAMATVCVVTAYGLISQYGLIGTGAAILYAIFALNTSRLTKKELSLDSAKMAVNWLIAFELALVYVHSTMYYQKIVSNTGLMFNTGGWDTIITACLFGLGTSLLPIVLLLVSITETREKAENERINTPSQN